MQRVPTLTGVAGHFKGESYRLEYGKTITVGRSREADFSLRRTEAYRAMNAAEQEADGAAKTVSGKHFQVTMYNLNSIEVRNLSSNGTSVDGKSIDVVMIDDIAQNAHEIHFGEHEVLRLEMQMHEDT
jgi:pSer/pThr/pTyr-binding forkhead associated (FHA) protein